MPHRWKESVVRPVSKAGDEAGGGVSLLSTSYNIVSNILLSKLIQYAYEIIGDYEREFLRNRSATDQILYIRWICISFPMLHRLLVVSLFSPELPVYWVFRC
jgi:hypothetical protein